MERNVQVAAVSRGARLVLLPRPTGIDSMARGEFDRQEALVFFICQVKCF